MESDGKQFEKDLSAVEQRILQVIRKSEDADEIEYPEVPVEMVVLIRLTTYIRQEQGLKRLRELLTDRGE